jgi:hypothetical protein
MKFVSSPAYTMGPKTGNINGDSMQPGVGSYEMDHRDIIDPQRPKWSFAHGEKLKLVGVTPDKLGPGSYETNNTTLGRRLAAHTRAKRDHYNG